MENDTTSTTPLDDSRTLEDRGLITPTPEPTATVKSADGLAATLYEVFYQASNHVHFNGDQMAVSFELASPHQQKAWLAVAEAILK